LDVVDKEGTVHATVEKLIYLATKAHYKEKLNKRAGK
jgi:hypothetical protein